MQTFKKAIVLGILGLSIQACRVDGPGRGFGTDPNNAAAFIRSAAFQPQRPDGTGSGTYVLIGNFTNDSYPDLVLLTQVSGTIYYRNTGRGFALPERLSLSSSGFSTGVTLASSTGFVAAEQGTGTLKKIKNVSGDLLPDLSFSLSGAQTLSMALGSGGTRTFLFALTNPGTSYMTEIQASVFSAGTAVSDFIGKIGKVMSANLNTDSIADFIAVPRTGTDPTRVYTGNSASIHSLYVGTPVSRTPTDDVLDFRLGQFVGDSATDLIMMTAAGFELFENQSTSSTFSFVPSALNVTTTGTKFIAGDFVNHDGKNDLYIIQSGTTGKLLKQGENLTFEDVSVAAFEAGAQGTSPLEVFSVDLNADGYEDLIELYSNAIIQVYINNQKTL